MKKLSMKKCFTMFLCLLTLLTITACNNKQPDQGQNPPVSGDEGNNSNTGNENTPQTNDNHHNQPLVMLFYPGNTNVITDTEGSLIMTSTKSLEELVEFYLEAVDSLGATQVSLDDAQEGRWVYNGTYEEGKSLTIELQVGDGSVNINISY